MSEVQKLETKQEKADRERRERIEAKANMLKDSYDALRKAGFKHEDAKELSWMEDE